MKKYKGILIFSGIALAAFLAYWFLGRKKKSNILGKAPEINEIDLQELQKTFATSNPYSDNVLTLAMRHPTPENSKYNYEGGGDTSPSWHPRAGEERIQTINKALFDNMVFSEIRTLIKSKGRVQEIENQRFDSASGMSRMPPNYRADLAAAVAAHARGNIAGRYYYDNLGQESPVELNGYFDDKDREGAN